MRKKSEPKLGSRDRRVLEALRDASKELECFEETVRVALVAGAVSRPRYPRPNLESPLRLVIGSSR
jgi:hypothetical protein